MPPAYGGPYTTVFNRRNRWSQRGIWPRIPLAHLARAEPPQVTLIDSSAVKAHRSAAARDRGGEGDACDQAIGRSRGGRTTKIHALCDEQGRPHAILPTRGNVADITAAGDHRASVRSVGEAG